MTNGEQRHHRWVRALLVVAALVSGCSSAPVTTTPVPVRHAEDQRLRVAVGEDEFLRGSPPNPNLGLQSDGLNPGIFETLTELTPAFGLRPGLALRWQARSPREWRFDLRPGVRFHNGAPLNAAAVVQSLRRLTVSTEDARGAVVTLRAARPRGLDPTSASAVGDLVVDVLLSEPNLRFAEQLANPRMAIQAPGTAAGDGSTPRLTPTGTGPFQFFSYRPGIALDVVANHRYWAGPPQLQSITFRFGAEKDASLLLATRQVDAVGYVATDLLANVSGSQNRRVMSVPARAAFLLLNRGGIDQWSTLREDAVRKAVSMAVDRKAAAQIAWRGYGEPNDSLIPKAVLGGASAAVRPARFDPAGARKALEEAGWLVGDDGFRSRKGKRLQLDVLLRRATEGLPAAASSIRTQLAAVGIATSMHSSRVNDPTPLQRVNAAEFDLFLDVRAQDDASPCALCRFFSIRPGGDLTVSGVVGGGPVVDALFDQAYSAASVDTARRVAAQLMSATVAGATVAVPLATLPNVWLLSPHVDGFEPAALGGAQQWGRVFLSS